jgi:hypothetical protein
MTRRRVRQERRSVTLAVLLSTGEAATQQPAAVLALDGGTPLRRLVEQLGAAGASVTVLTRPAYDGPVKAELAHLNGTVASLRGSGGPANDLEVLAGLLESPAQGPVVVAAADVVLHAAVLAGMLADPRSGVTLLTGGAEQGMWGELVWPVRAPAGVVIAAASPYHRVNDADSVSLGVLRVAEPHRGPVAAVARRAATIVRAGALTPLDSLKEDALALLLVALVREGVRVSTVPIRGFAWGRPTDAASAQQAAHRLAEVDEQRARVNAAVKPDDGFFVTFFVSPYSKHLARGAARLGVSPNAVTVLSMVLGVVAAGLFALGSRPALVAGALVLHVAFTLDCVDGQLARYTGAFSALGAYLDAVFDRAKEYVVYAGLAVGAARQGDDVWTLAAVALTLQTAHHTLQFSWPGGDQPRVMPRTGPLTEAEIRGYAASGAARAGSRGTAVRRIKSIAGRLVASLSGRTASRPLLVYVKRILPFPIGERFALITLGAAFGGPRLVFVAFITWVSLAITWSTTGRVLRSVSR